VAQPLEYQGATFDLDDPHSVVALAEKIGDDICADVFCALLPRMTPRLRAQFACTVLAGPMGAIAAAVGVEVLEAELALLMNGVRSAARDAAAALAAGHTKH
jgi:hypothetical protein